MSIIVDTHAHLYPCYDPSLFFRKSYENLERLAPSSVKCLILTERVQENYFERGRYSGTLGFYPVLQTKEEESFAVLLTDDQKLYCVRGRQIVSKEGLEVLALGSAGRIQYGSPLRDILEKIAAEGSLAVIPWSFGKWLLTRKKILSARLEDSSLHFFLGDIWGRSTLFGGADLFQIGERSGRILLGGTDTLPVPGEEIFSGSMATVLEGEFNHDLPWQSIKKLLPGTPRLAGWHCATLKGIQRQMLLRVQ